MATALLPPCDETRGLIPSSAADEAGRDSNQPGVLLATVAGSSLTFVVGSIVNVALPAMQREFGLGASGAQWIVNAYLLPVGALVLVGGAIGDHYGRRPTFIAGMAVFLIACLACAIAPTFTLLLTARAVQGVGAALIAPTSLAIIAAAFSGQARGKAVGSWAAAGAAAGAVAPVLGGWIVDTASWRWAFAAVAPFAALALAIAWHSVPDSKAAAEDKSPLDWTGAALAGFGLFGIIWALIALPSASSDQSLDLLALAGGVLLLIAFVLWERHKGERAMTPPGLFVSTSFTGISLLTFFLYGAMGGLMVVLPYTLIQAFSYGATASGAAILPFPLVMGLLSRLIGGTIAQKVGTRTILTVGSALVAGGFFLLSRLPASDPNYWTDVLPGLVLIALGMSASVAPLTSAVLASAGDAYSGVASGVNNAVSRIAGLVATALLGPVLASGSDLVANFGWACLAGVGLALASATSALLLVRSTEVDGEAPADP